VQRASAELAQSMPIYALHAIVPIICIKINVSLIVPRGITPPTIPVKLAPPIAYLALLHQIAITVSFHTLSIPLLESHHVLSHVRQAQLTQFTIPLSNMSVKIVQAFVRLARHLSLIAFPACLATYSIITLALQLVQLDTILSVVLVYDALPLAKHAQLQTLITAHYVPQIIFTTILHAAALAPPVLTQISLP
jgi:hypothetical protein